MRNTNRQCFHPKVWTTGTSSHILTPLMEIIIFLWMLLTNGIGLQHNAFFYKFNFDRTLLINVNEVHWLIQFARQRIKGRKVGTKLRSNL